MDNIKTLGNIGDTEKICPDCGEVIRIMTIPILNQAMEIMCSCREAKVKEERRQCRYKGSQIIKANMIKNSGLLKRWANKTFDNFTPQTGQHEAYAKSFEYAENYKTKNGLILCGTAGCGKTHLASAIVNKIISDLTIDDYIAEKTGLSGYMNDPRIEDFTPVRFVSTIDMLSEIKSTYTGDGAATQQVIGKYKTSEVLILDDLGTENMTEWVREKMFEIINYRYGEEMSFVITTNKTPDELKADFGYRIFDRIREMCAFVSINTPSQRQTAL